MSKYDNLLNKNQIASARSKIIGRETEMKKNDGGGVSFVISKWDSLSRFLNLGAESSTYYISKNKHQYNNYNNTVSCIKENGLRVVETIKNVSVNGLAHKNDHAIFALALCFVHGDEFTKQAASDSLTSICRTGTHILMFVQFIKGLRGFGKTVRNSINNWYYSKNDKDLAFQLSKYQNRDGWAHRDVFCLTHPKFGTDSVKNNIARWSMGLNISTTNHNSDALEFLGAIDYIKTISDMDSVLCLIEKYSLQREHLPTEYLNNIQVQEYLLPNLGGTALLRNLGNMSKSGLLKPLSKASKYVCEKLEDEIFLSKNRIHPLSLYLALKTYSSGSGIRGKGSWDVNPHVVSSLEKAFYKSFDFVEPTNNNFFFGLDVSGSMTSNIGDSPVSCHEVATIIGLTMSKVEPYCFVGGFSSDFIDLGINSSDNIKTALKKTYKSNFSSTNPGSAIEYAIDNKLDVDVFVFITDNDINTGKQPSQVLSKYRRVMNKPKCKMIVIGLTSTNFSIADPKDPLMLDIAGFSPDVTTVINSFVKN
jgi:60 kDa SS-A/Ro ribonucleoprotein